MPSQASDGNLGEIPPSTPLSTLPGGTFPDPQRDHSPIEGKRQSVSEPLISGSVPPTGPCHEVFCHHRQLWKPGRFANSRIISFEHCVYQSEIPVQDPIKDSLPSGSRQPVLSKSYSSNEEDDDEGLRTLIAPSVTSLDGAKKISSAGTSQSLEAGISLSVRETQTELHSPAE